MELKPYFFAALYVKKTHVVKFKQDTFEMAEVITIGLKFHTTSKYCITF